MLKRGITRLQGVPIFYFLPLNVLLQSLAIVTLATAQIPSALGEFWEVATRVMASPAKDVHSRFKGSLMGRWVPDHSLERLWLWHHLGPVPLLPGWVILDCSLTPKSLVLSPVKCGWESLDLSPRGAGMRSCV